MNLKPFVNQKPLWDAFNEELDRRIASAHRSLEQCDELSDIYRFQGEIKALKKLKQLRDYVNGSDG